MPNLKSGALNRRSHGPRMPAAEANRLPSCWVRGSRKSATPISSRQPAMVPARLCAVRSAAVVSIPVGPLFFASLPAGDHDIPATPSAVASAAEVADMIVATATNGAAVRAQRSFSESRFTPTFNGPSRSGFCTFRALAHMGNRGATSG